MRVYGERVLQLAEQSKQNDYSIFVYKKLYIQSTQHTCTLFLCNDNFHNRTLHTFKFCNAHLYDDSLAYTWYIVIMINPLCMTS